MMGRVDCEDVQPMGYIARKRVANKANRSWAGSGSGRVGGGGGKVIGRSIDNRVIQTSLLKLQGGDPCNMLNEVLIRRTLIQTLKRANSSESVGKGEGVERGSIDRKPLTPVQPWIKEMNMKAEQEKKKQNKENNLMSRPKAELTKTRGFDSQVRRSPSFNDLKQYGSSFRGDEESDESEEEDYPEKENKMLKHGKYSEKGFYLPGTRKRDLKNEMQFFSKSMESLSISECDGEGSYEDEDEEDDKKKGLFDSGIDLKST